MEDTCKQCGKWPTDKPVLVDGGILCVDCASNLLRWRKWPEECPEAGGKYLVIWFDDAKGLWLEDIKVVQCNEPLRECFFKLGYFYWRPIGPLPKESE